MRDSDKKKKNRTSILNVGEEIALSRADGIGTGENSR